MLNTQPKSAAFVANVAALAALSLGFVAAGTFSASAQNKPTAQSAYQAQPAVRRWHRQKVDGLYLAYPGHASPVDSGWRATLNPQCETVPNYFPQSCPGFINSNGG